MLGKPDVETKEAISYRFDPGFGGWDYQFKTQDGKVTGVEIKGLD
jgi:hypothetical protein